MSVLPRALAALAAVVATMAHAGEEPRRGEAAPAPASPPWAFSITIYPTDVRGGENYTSAIAAADRGPLHLEARYNYESIGARSAYVGWAFSGGDTLTWQVTPIVGGAWGTTQSFIVGAEASLAWRAVDVYVEAEYVPTSSKEDAYTYVWSELGFRPVEWLRLGIVGQRTRNYGGDRDIQRGLFAQVTIGAITIGGYGFNPGSSDRVFMAMLGAKF
jgi:hypothetical protein